MKKLLLNYKNWHRAKLVLFLLLSTLWLLSPFFQANAQNINSAAIRHTPPKNSQIPLPGVPIILSFDLSGISGVISRERLFVVRDGKLLDATLLEGPVEGAEQLAHNAVVHAPLVELTYWAAVTLADGSIVTSPHFTLRRSCVPNIALAPIDDPENSSIQERLTRYVQQSKDLEKDLAQYEQALELIESLVGQMKEGE